MHMFRITKCTCTNMYFNSFITLMHVHMYPSLSLSLSAFVSCPSLSLSLPFSIHSSLPLLLQSLSLSYSLCIHPTYCSQYVSPSFFLPHVHNVHDLCSWHEECDQILQQIILITNCVTQESGKIHSNFSYI